MKNSVNISFFSARKWNSGYRGLKFQFSWSFELNVLLIFVISFGMYTYFRYVEYPFHVPEEDTCCCFGNENVRKQLNRILGANASRRLDKDSFIILFHRKRRKNHTALISRVFQRNKLIVEKIIVIVTFQISSFIPICMY